jgi:hypothetical protein
MGLVNTPTWLLSVMGKSGLFRPWAIKLAEVIAWFQKDTESGGFTYWPDGPLAAPKRLAPPLWNRGVVTHNTAMVHRGESNGPPGSANPKGLGLTRPRHPRTRTAGRSEPGRRDRAHTTTAAAPRPLGRRALRTSPTLGNTWITSTFRRTAPRPSSPTCGQGHPLECPRSDARPRLSGF